MFLLGFDYHWQVPDLASWGNDQLITNSVHQGSILGLFLFNIFINDLYTRGESSTMKIADDTKLGGVVDYLEG